MKSLILLVFSLALAFGSGVQAQSTNFETALKSTRSGLARDTIGKDSTRYFTPVTALGTQYRSVVMYVDVTRISGNPSGSMIYWEGSHNNSTWYPVDSIAVDSASNTYRKAQIPYQDKYLRARIKGGTSTMSASAIARVYAVKP